MAGIYVHIPFCESRCLYCGFFSTTVPQRQDAYVDALCREMALRRDYLSAGRTNSDEDLSIHTLYIGGGTPSQLSLSNMGRIVKAVHENYDTALVEFTVEVNPDDVTPELAEGLAALGVNRVSMGAQTFDNQRLAFLRRRHRAEDVPTAVSVFRRVGIGNISIDLMYGFPDETLDQWKADIGQAQQLDVQHISAYCLTFEEGTPLMRMLQQGKVKETDEETSRQMYEKLASCLQQVGYEHYEISNFAKPGFRSRHNSGYWQDIPYIGFGAAAHSYNRATRQWNVSHLQTYIEQIRQGHLPMEQERIDERTHYNDLITTALRTSDGLPLQLLAEQQQTYLQANAARYLTTGELELTHNRLRLTPKGIFVSDMIMADLILV